MGIRATRIALTGGDEIDVVNGVTVLVGPNNAGKSLAIRESIDFLARGVTTGPPRLAVASVSLEYQGTPDDYFAHLAEEHELREPGYYSYGHVAEEHLLIGNVPITKQLVSQSWGNVAGHDQMALSLIAHLDVRERLNLLQDSQIFDPSGPLPNQQPLQPTQQLWLKPELEEQVSHVLYQAFGVPLSVQRGGIPSITLHLGRPSRPPTGLTPDLGYLREMKALPLWREQGEGMRSFLGIILGLMTVRRPLIFIDEPEAFLHPPQARLLGRLLLTLAGPETQVVVATHSADLLDGLIAANADESKLSIVRITRQGSLNHASQVGAQTLKALYDDPLIRYFGILDGLFANATVLCEADGDCTYYRAVMGTISALDDGTPTDSLDLHFTHCAGKSRLPLAVRALRSAGAAVVCVADIDILRDDIDFNRLVQAAGGEPGDFKKWRAVIAAAIGSKGIKPDRSTARSKINDILNMSTDKYLTSNEVNVIKGAVHAESGWQEAKRFGRRSLSGDPLAAFDKLCGALRNIGVLIVPEGELERFDNRFSSENKAEWLRKVLESGSFAENRAACEFVMAILNTAVEQQRRLPSGEQE